MAKTVKIGVFMPSATQVLDMACVDIFGVMSREYLSDMSDQIPEHVYNAAPSVTISYISTPEQGDDIPMTSGLMLKATHTFKDEAVAPGNLDIVLVPGPHPKAEFDEEGLRWLKRHSETEGVDILSVCTGLFVCGAAGIADGKKCSGPRGLQAMLRERFPKIQLVGDDQRWVQDGNIWSSGGVTNGNDLVAAYARATDHFPQPIVEMGLRLTDTGDREQFYTKVADKV